jgi:two-component system, OmpR family, sensor histidine kinase MtrB
MQVRVLASALAAGMLAIVVTGSFVADRARDGLFHTRVDQTLAESAHSAQRVQSTFDSATASTATEVQQLLYDVTTEQGSSGTSQREVILRAQAQSTTLGPRYVASDVSYVPVVSPEMVAAVADGEQHWQPVELPGGTGPGVVVGQAVTAPLVGEYQLYFVYSLQDEQDRLDFLLRTVATGGLVLVALLGAVAYLVTRQSVRPVVAASVVASRFAEGDLNARMIVRGTDEMATLATTFNEMALNLSDQIARMEELSTLQRRFVSDVSHELRTPLTTIRMAAEVLSEASGSFDPAPRRSAELMTTQLDRFEDLLADLLEISRFDAGAAVLDAQMTDIAQVVREVLETVAPLAERRGSQVLARIPEGVIADIDPRRVARIVRNLVVNAVEHAEGTPVEVDLAADTRAVSVRVRDHGVGMSVEEAGRVFDRFWRADPARARTTGGTGLGLAISAEDARLHGGRLEAWGRKGDGASFLLTLPLRAGITVTGSPLDLVPDRPVEDVPRTHDAAAMPRLDPETGAVPVVRKQDDA